MSLLQMNKSSRTKGYDFTDPASIEQKIRADLSRLGTVGEIKGNILVVDGDWYLNDVKATVEGREVSCVKDGDTIAYANGRNPIVVTDLQGVYEPGRDKSLVQIFDAINKESHPEKRFRRNLDDLIAPVLSVTFPLLLVWLSSNMLMELFDTWIALVPVSIITVVVVGLVAYAIFEQPIRIHRVRKLEGRLPYSVVAARYQDAIAAHAIRTCRNRGWEYLDDLKIYGSENCFDKDMSVSFKIRDEDGVRRTAWHDGMSITGFGGA